MSRCILSLSLWFALLISMVLSSNLAPRQSCSAGYTLCSPPGATGDSTYDIGDGIVNLYRNILDTVNPQAPAPGASPNPNGPAKRQSVNTMCCATGLSCLLLQGAEVPMCYDKFTTDYALPDGDYGTVSNGSFVSSSGVLVNLISGDYAVPNGQTGNIYSSATSDKPNTATLPIPTQYTSSGVGSAVPASQLGSSASYTSLPTVTITAGTAMSPSAPSTSLSLSGPEVSACSTCCVECGIPSTTINATMPTITSMPSGSGTFPSYVTGNGSASITPSITVGAGTSPRSLSKELEFGVFLGVIVAAVVLNYHY